MTARRFLLDVAGPIVGTLQYLLGLVMLCTLLYGLMMLLSLIMRLAHGK